MKIMSNSGFILDQLRIDIHSYHKRNIIMSNIHTVRKIPIMYGKHDVPKTVLNMPRLFRENTLSKTREKRANR